MTNNVIHKAAIRGTCYCCGEPILPGQQVKNTMLGKGRMTRMHTICRKRFIENGFKPLRQGNAT
jgi:hypothetical protein